MAACAALGHLTSRAEQGRRERGSPAAARRERRAGLCPSLAGTRAGHRVRSAPSASAQLRTPSPHAQYSVDGAVPLSSFRRLPLSSFRRQGHTTSAGRRFRVHAAPGCASRAACCVVMQLFAMPCETNGARERVGVRRKRGRCRASAGAGPVEEGDDPTVGAGAAHKVALGAHVGDLVLLSHLFFLEDLVI